MSAQTRDRGALDPSPESDREPAPARRRERPSERDADRSTRSDEFATPKGGALDTLAQLGQRQSSISRATDSQQATETLRKRARAEFFSTPLAINLAKLRSSLEASYRNTVYCSAVLTQEHGKIIGSYCGNRWCSVCNRIRTARAMQRYIPMLVSWSDKYFVTLTLANVQGFELSDTIAGMVRAFQAAKLAMRRTDRHKLVALRKLECTYNERTQSFHPHFLVIVKGESAARLLLLRWLESHPGDAELKGQDVRPCDNQSAREMFKYFTKLVAATRIVATPALDTIFRSMKGHRVCQPVGFILPRTVPDEAEESLEPLDATEAPIRHEERIVWDWCQSLTDWIDLETGLCLTGYEPDDTFRRLVEGH